MCHAYFSNNVIRISCELNRSTLVFFSCEMAVNTARKAWFKVLWRVAPPGFPPRKETRLRAKAYLCTRETLFSLYFSYMGCFHQLMVCSCGRGKTKQIHKYKHTHTFQKTISRNQAHAWFNNIIIS